MNFTSFVAARYLSASRRHHFVSWITILSILGIAIGVAAMIVVLSVINGFEKELRNRFLAANAHILAYRFPSGLTDYPSWEQKIWDAFGEDLTGSAPFVHAETMAKHNSAIHTLLVRGIDPEKREHVQSLRTLIQPPEALDQLQAEITAVEQGQALSAVPNVIIGFHLLKSLGVNIGDTIELVAPSHGTEGSLFSSMRRFKIIGFYNSGLQHYDAKLALLSIPAAQQLFGMGEAVTGIEMGLQHPNDSVEVAQRFSQQFHLSVKEWQSFNKNIFDAMEKERIVIAVIVALVAFVASFNILTTLFVNVTQKRREISLFKALGCQNHQIIWIFLKQSIFMGILGGVLGLGLAYVVSQIIANFEIIKLPEIYLLAKLPIEFDIRVYAGVSLGGLVIACIAGLYPAWMGAKISPIDGLRHDDR
jgi:lipoprotein-releasing system permease protein